MKKTVRRLLFFFTLVFVIILSFSLVQAATPSIVLNAVNIKAPYTTGSHNFDTEGRNNEVEADANHDAKTGIVNTIASSSPGRNRRSSGWGRF